MNIYSQAIKIFHRPHSTIKSRGMAVINLYISGIRTLKTLIQPFSLIGKKVKS